MDIPTAHQCKRASSSSEDNRVWTVRLIGIEASRANQAQGSRAANRAETVDHHHRRCCPSLSEYPTSSEDKATTRTSPQTIRRAFDPHVTSRVDEKGTTSRPSSASKLRRTLRRHPYAENEAVRCTSTRRCFSFDSRGRLILQIGWEPRPRPRGEPVRGHTQRACG